MFGLITLPSSLVEDSHRLSLNSYNWKQGDGECPDQHHCQSRFDPDV